MEGTKFDELVMVEDADSDPEIFRLYDNMIDSLAGARREI
jgi:hypothetical protein